MEVLRAIFCGRGSDSMAPHNAIVGAGLLAKAVCHSKFTSTDTPLSRASPLSHWFRGGLEITGCLADDDAALAAPLAGFAGAPVSSRWRRGCIGEYHEPCRATPGPVR